MNDETNLGKLARELAVARRSHGVVAAHALERLSGFGDAYQLQERVRVELGATVVGWKLAAPPSAEVISAPLFSTGCMASCELLVDAALLRDGVECELAFRIDHALPAGECSREELAAAIGAVMPAFGLLCSPLPAKFASPREHIVADCLGHGAVVLGAPLDDWRALVFDELQVTLWADDALVVDKAGGNPFGDPLRAVALLAKHLAQRGQTLEAGTFVLAGSHTGVFHAPPKGRLRCAFEGVGEVALTVSGAAPTSSKENSDAGR